MSSAGQQNKRFKQTLLNCSVLNRQVWSSKANVNDQYSRCALCLVKLRSRLPQFWCTCSQTLCISTVTHLAWDLCIFSKLTHISPLKYYLWHFIFTKFIKTVASGCQILWLKCTKFDFGWGFSQDLTRELTAFTAPFPKTQHYAVGSSGLELPVTSNFWIRHWLRAWVSFH